MPCSLRDQFPAIFKSRSVAVQVMKRERRRKSEGERGGEETLVLSVHHPEPAVREAAVRQLGKILKHKNKVNII